MNDPFDIKPIFGKKHRPEVKPKVDPKPVVHFLPEGLFDDPKTLSLVRKMGLSLGLWTIGLGAVLWAYSGEYSHCSKADINGIEPCSRGGGNSSSTSGHVSSFGGFGKTGGVRGGGG